MTPERTQKLIEIASSIEDQAEALVILASVEHDSIIIYKALNEVMLAVDEAIRTICEQWEDDRSRTLSKTKSRLVLKDLDDLLGDLK